MRNLNKIHYKKKLIKKMMLENIVVNRITKNNRRTKKIDRMEMQWKQNKLRIKMLKKSYPTDYLYKHLHFQIIFLYDKRLN